MKSCPRLAREGQKQRLSMDMAVLRWLRTSYGKKIRTLRDILGRLVSCLESCLSYRRLFQGLAQLFLDSLSWIKSNGILSEPDRALILDRMLRSLERDGHHARLWVAPE